MKTLKTGLLVMVMLTVVALSGCQNSTSSNQGAGEKSQNISAKNEPRDSWMSPAGVMVPR